LIAIKDDAEADTVDLVLDVGRLQIEPPSGTPDDVASPSSISRSRRTGDPLIGQLTGDATSRRIFLEQFQLQMARR
jgi:hypothetical protein